MLALYQSLFLRKRNIVMIFFNESDFGDQHYDAKFWLARANAALVTLIQDKLLRENTENVKLEVWKDTIIFPIKAFNKALMDNDQSISFSEFCENQKIDPECPKALLVSLLKQHVQAAKDLQR